MGQIIMKEQSWQWSAKILFLPVSSKSLSLLFSIGCINCIGKPLAKLEE
jgi:hypothetical protein